MRILALALLASALVSSASAQCLMAEFLPAADVALAPGSDTLVRSYPNTFAYSASAEVNDLQRGAWVPTTTLDGWSVSCVEAGFGFSVSMTEMFGVGEILAVAAPWDDKYGPGTGSVVVYERGADGFWTYGGHFLAPSPVAGGLFGYSISASGEFLGISSPGDGSGAVDTYARLGGFWTHTNRFTAPPSAHGFGKDLAQSGPYATVLADGAAYRYDGYMGWLMHTAVPSTTAIYDSIDAQGNVLIMGSSTAGIVTAFVGDTEVQTISVGSTITDCAIGGPGLLISAADGLHIYAPVLAPGGDIVGWVESNKIQDTGVLDAAYDRFTLSDAAGVRLYSFDLAECHGPKRARALLPAGKHP